MTKGNSVIYSIQQSLISKFLMKETACYFGMEQAGASLSPPKKACLCR